MGLEERNALLSKINSAYGLPLVSTGKSSTSLKVLRRTRMSTGLPELDIALGGGYPLGFVEHAYGEYSSGKTRYALHLAAVFQRHCRNCGKLLIKTNWQTMESMPVSCCKQPEPKVVAFLDAEGTFNASWAARCGVNVDNLIYVSAVSGEQYSDVGTELLGSGEIDFLILDSVAATNPTADTEKSAEDANMGVHARLMGRLIRSWLAAQAKAKLSNLDRDPPSVLLLNQIRLKVGFVMGDPRVTPGGKAPDFFSAIGTMITSKKVEVDASDVPLWQETSIFYKKNKTAVPKREALVRFAFRDVASMGIKAGGFNVAEQVLLLAVGWGLALRKGSVYYLEKDGPSYKGASAAAVALATKPALFEMLLREVFIKEKVIQEGGHLEKKQPKEKKGGKVLRPADDVDDIDVEEDE